MEGYNALNDPLINTQMTTPPWNGFVANNCLLKDN